MLCGVWNWPGPVPRSPQDLSQSPSLLDLGDARIDVAVADECVAGGVPGDVGHLAEIAVAGGQRRVRMLERGGVFVRSLLLAAEHHIDAALGVEFDHHVRALVGYPDIVLGVHLHGVGERPRIEIVADLAQIIPVGVELQKLRGRGAVSRAGGVAPMQDEGVALGIERHA